MSASAGVLDTEWAVASLSNWLGSNGGVVRLGVNVVDGMSSTLELACSEERLYKATVS